MLHSLTAFFKKNYSHATQPNPLSKSWWVDLQISLKKGQLTHHPTIGLGWPVFPSRNHASYINGKDASHKLNTTVLFGQAKTKAKVKASFICFTNKIQPWIPDSTFIVFVMSFYKNPITFKRFGGRDSHGKTIQRQYKFLW